jgi:hypothetical protein
VNETNIIIDLDVDRLVSNASTIEPKDAIAELPVITSRIVERFHEFA